MRTMIRLRAARYLALLMVSILAVPYLASGALAAQPKESMSQTVVLFPLDNATGVANSRIISDLDAFIRDGLYSNSKYQVVVFTQRLPAIQRLLAMQPDRKADVTLPFSTDNKAVQRASVFAKAIGAEVMVVGAVSKYTYDDKNGSAEVVATVDLLNSQTGKSIKSVAATGRASKPAGDENITEARLAADAVKDAGRKIIEGLTDQKYQEPVTSAQAKALESKGSKKSFIPILLLSLGVGLLLGGGGGGTSDTGGGIDPPPDPPF